jgi:hypothetical protein
MRGSEEIAEGKIPKDIVSVLLNCTDSDEE